MLKLALRLSLLALGVTVMSGPPRAAEPSCEARLDRFKQDLAAYTQRGGGMGDQDCTEATTTVSMLDALKAARSQIMSTCQKPYTDEAELAWKVAAIFDEPDLPPRAMVKALCK